MKHLCAVLVLTGLVLGCRDTSVRPGPGLGDGDEKGVTIYDVQSDAMPVGTPVDLYGVIVVATDTYGGRSGGLHVMEPDGGPYSGVLVFLRDDTAAGLVPGDRVDVLGGEKDEFALRSDESGNTLTEITAPDGGSIIVNKVGLGQVPAPQLVQPQELAGDPEAAEKWEGVLVRVENVRALNRPHTVSSSDPTLLQMNVTGPYLIESSLTELSADIERDDCFASITGVGDYFFDYKLLPRFEADIVRGGTECLSLETADGACTDGVDNDFNGFADCNDFNCQAAFAGCTAEATIQKIQDGTIPAETRVRLTDLLVTARSSNGRTVWVQHGEVAAPLNGLTLYNGRDPFDAKVDIGASLVVSGEVVEFDAGGDTDDADGSLTELVNLIVDSVEEGAGVPVPMTDIPMVEVLGEAYESVLVELVNMEVKDVKPGSRLEITVTDGTTELRVDSDIYSYDDAEVGQCVSAIQGVVTFNSFADVISVLPRQDGIDATPGNCEGDGQPPIIGFP